MARRAHSLQTLLAQINALVPLRNKASDGWIGDTAHANRSSDHNPDAAGVVHAQDITHDPIRLSGGWLTDTLVRHRDPRIKYIIWNHRIWNTAQGWQSYTGSSPHTQHVHISVVSGPAGDNASPWNGFTPSKEADDMTPEQDQKLQYIYDAIEKGGPSIPGGQPLKALIVTAASAYVQAKEANDGVKELKARPIVDATVAAQSVVDELISRGVTGGASLAEVQEAVRDGLNAARISVVD